MREASTTQARCSTARASGSRPSTCRTAREHFAAKGMHVDLIKLYGSMELAPLAGLADAIVDLVSTGNTLKANELVAVEEIAHLGAAHRQPGVAQAEARQPCSRSCESFAPAVAAAQAAERRWIAQPRHHERRHADAAPARYRRSRISTRGSRAGRLRVGAGSGSRCARRDILADVEARGDAALVEYTRRFDRVQRATCAASSRSRAAELRARVRSPPGTRSATRWPPRRSASARYHEQQRAHVVELHRRATATSSASR